MHTLPNFLTVFRILLIPVVIWAFFADTTWGRWITILSFCSACITDFLDGYLARTLDQESRLGQFLDPIADKMLVVTTLFLLAAFDRISRLAIIPAIIILCREIMISGLREHLSDLRVSIPVSYLARWKTFFQMAAIAALLFNSIPTINTVIIGETLLWIASILTLITGYNYLKNSLKYF